MRNTYLGTWSNSCGSYNGTDYEDTNAKRLARIMRKIAKGNCLAGGTAHWSICKNDKEDGPIMSGSVKA